MFLAVAAYQQLAEACDYPLHLGITEAGGLQSGTVKSSIGMGSLLWAGIGDTIRVSLSADPVEEVQGRLRHPEGARPAPPRRHRDLLPVLRAPAIRRDQDRRGAGEAARAHHHADDALGHRLRRERPGRGARDRYRLHRRRQRHASGLSRRRAAHRLKDESIVDHLVELVEKKAAEIEAAKAKEDADSGRVDSRAAEASCVLRDAARMLHSMRKNFSTTSRKLLSLRSGRRPRLGGRTIFVAAIAHVRLAAGARHPGPSARRACGVTAPSSRRRARSPSATAMREMATPIFEFTEVFARPIGETTDIVTKEMYTFADRGGEELTLRPEYTAGIVPRRHLQRADAEPAAQALRQRARCSATSGRRKGRFRQFHQIDVELIGVAQPHADVEVIALGADILDALGVLAGPCSSSTRSATPRAAQAYRTALVDYYRGASRQALRGQPPPPRAQSAAHPRFEGRGRQAHQRRRAALRPNI